MRFVPCIRWSGGKRKQSEDIIARMPHKIGTLWIPFLGGGSVMFQALNSNIKYDRIICSDIYNPLMQIWDDVRNDPETLLQSYSAMYASTHEHGERYYNEMVDHFNGTQNYLTFHYLTRACMRGNIEFDKYGNFCTKFQNTKTDAIITPEALRPIIYRWHEAIQNVEFRCERYDAMLYEIKEGDYCFFDPPYFDGTWYKDNQIDMDVFYTFLRNLPCDYSITLNGDKDIYPIPSDLYTKHEYIYYGVNKTSSGMQKGSRDSLWMCHNPEMGYDYSSDYNNVRQNERGSGGSIPQVTDIKMMGDIAKELSELNRKLDMFFAKVAESVGLDSKYFK